MKRILVTRSPHQASELAERLRALGADPILIPIIETVEPTSFAPLDAALGNLDRFHWLLFTSANAVEAFGRRRRHLGMGKGIGGTKIAAVGPATARALESIGLAPDLIPPQAVAESLATALLPHAIQPDGDPTRFLLIRAKEAREHLPETLRAAGAEVTVASAYQTVIPAGSIAAIRELFSCPENYPDAITFTSSSTVRNLFALLKAAEITLSPNHAQQTPSYPVLNANFRPVIASIGPVTSTTLRELGYPPQVEASEANVASLAENLMRFFT